MIDYGSRYHITDIICLDHSLERNADDVAVEYDRSAAVAGIYRSVSLDDKMTVGAVGSVRYEVTLNDRTVGGAMYLWSGEFRVISPVERLDDSIIVSE